MIYVNYLVKIDGSLKDALATAWEVNFSTGLKPDSIDWDGRAIAFNAIDARSVVLGSLSLKAYVQRHEIKPVLSDAEESD